MEPPLKRELLSSSLSAKSRTALVAAAIACGVLSYFARAQWTRSPGASSQESGSASVLREAAPSTAAAEKDATESAIHFYSERVRRDPEDVRSQTALAEYYLQRGRESGNEDYLPMALQAAAASLAAVDPVRNIGGLTALARAEFANHDFAVAREHALRLTELQPGKGEPYAILADACLELGDYDRAMEALRQLEKFDAKNAGTETRLARWAILRGDVPNAQQHLGLALSLLRDQPEPPREAIAWCHWQSGETAFSMGDYTNAERHYQDALTVAPDYFRALSSLGRLRAAGGDLPAAIAYYERAVRIIPAVESMAALGDLYHLSRREREARARYELVEQLGEHSRKVHGTPHDRHIALFSADHDFKTEEAYALARGEYEAGRHDICGADALAWTALKSGRLDEAQAAMQEALKLGTRDARLLYHGGMITRATGDNAAATDYLQRALVLNPGFDPLQSAMARETLRSLKSP